jgi:hypothetical protein
VPFLPGTDETCNFTAPAPGDWFTMMHGLSAYTGVQVKMSLAERFGSATNFGFDILRAKNTLVAQAVTIASPVSATHIGAMVTEPLVGGGSPNVSFGLYSNRVGVDGDEPATLLMEFSGTFVVGLNEISLPETQLAAGKYWLAILPRKDIRISSDSAAGNTDWKYVVYTSPTSLPASWPVISSTTLGSPMSVFFRGFK